MDKVTILPSVALSEMRLEELAGRQGNIVESKYDPATGAILGAWVKLDGEPYLQEQEWYIPISSLGI